MKVFFTTHAAKRWNERFSKLKTPIQTEFNNAQENKRILNDTRLMVHVFETFGTDFVAKFFTTENVVFVCKELSLNNLVCVTVYPTNDKVFKSIKKFKKHEIEEIVLPEIKESVYEFKTYEPLKPTIFHISGILLSDVKRKVINLGVWPCSENCNDIDSLLFNNKFHKEMITRMKTRIRSGDNYTIATLLIWLDKKQEPYIYNYS